MIAIFFVACLLLMFRSRSAWKTMPLPLVALMLLSLLSTLTIVVGRMGYWDKEFVLSSRYTTITLLGIAATYLLALALAHSPAGIQCSDRRMAMVICDILLIAFVTGLPGGYQRGLVEGAAQKVLRSQQLEVVLNFETRSDQELASVYPKLLRERLIYWKSHHLVPFNQPAP
jgi:hypothetical protein